MFIGLDQSTSCTGIALYYPIKREVQYGIIEPKQNDYLARIKTIIIALTNVIKNNRLKTEHVYLEQPFYFTGSSSAQILITLEKIIKWELYKLDIPFSTLPPNTKKGWPALLGADGTKEKFAELIQTSCPHKFVKNPAKKEYKTTAVMPYDASDAIGIVLAGANVENIAALKYTPLDLRLLFNNTD